MKIYLVIIKFFFIGALFIVSNHVLYLSNPVDFLTFKQLYFNWLENIFDSGSEITAYVVNSNWLP